MKGWFDFVPHDWATLAIAVALMVFTLGYLGFGPVGRLKAKTGQKLPETWIYNSDKLRDYVAEAGKDPYRAQLRWDMLFAILYGAGLFVVLDGTLGWSLHQPRRFPLLLLAFVPVAAAVADLLEDVILLRITASADTPRWEPAAWLVNLSRGATVAKFVLVFASGGLVLAGAIALALGGPHSWGGASPPSVKPPQAVQPEPGSLHLGLVWWTNERTQGSDGDGLPDFEDPDAVDPHSWPENGPALADARGGQHNEVGEQRLDSAPLEKADWVSSSRRWL